MLGMANLQLGHKAEAKKILDRALTAGIPDHLAKQAQDAIVELDKAGIRHVSAPANVGMFNAHK